MREFESNAAGNPALIRSLLEDDPEAFYADAIHLLADCNDSGASSDSTGFQHLAGLMASSALLLRALCDPKLAKHQAIALAHAATRSDPNVDATLARALADSAGPNGGPVPMEAAPRLMEILAGISDGSRILPWMMRMMRNPNPHIRSKAVLMIGRGGRSVQWLKGRLVQGDARIRANAIESMWCVNTVEAQVLLRQALADANNRVVGNALLGLYYKGDCSVLPEIDKMTRNKDGLFRSTAAWVIGETGDARFTQTLLRMLVEADATVRKRALAAIGRIKAASAKSSQGAEWRMAGTFHTGQPIGHKTHRDTHRKVYLTVASNAPSNEGASDDAGALPKVLHTQFMLTEGNRNVLFYKVTEKPLTGAMSVMFVFPESSEPMFAPWSAGSSHCLAWKRPADLWRHLPFTAASETGLWETLWRSVQPDPAAPRGKRHLIVVATDRIPKLAGDGLISNILDSRTSLQVISAVGNSPMEDFSRRANGRLRTFESESEIPELIQQAYLNLLTRYEISYQTVAPEAPMLKVRVQTDSGWGEVSIPIPKQ